MLHDVIIVGGSYAGMAAALQLLRARRKVLIIDADLRRNRFASESHGFLGQDGIDPDQIARAARDQLKAYPTLTWLEDTATDAEQHEEGFAVTTSDRARHDGRRLIFATGVGDTLPTIDGLPERWGRSVFHCPYCHGYELDLERIGVIATGPLVFH
jgi:thioredoxin reductase